MLLDSKRIGTEIPDVAGALGGLDPSWKTGPQAIAGVRNRLIPRVERSRGPVGPPMYWSTRGGYRPTTSSLRSFIDWA